MEVLFSGVRGYLVVSFKWVKFSINFVRWGGSCVLVGGLDEVFF